MEKRDMRSLPREAREERRRQVIALREGGMTYDEIAQLTDLSRTGVFDICKRYVQEGTAALRDKPSGRAVTQKRALTEQQEIEVRVLMRDQMPDQLKMPFALWTRHAVRELIRQRTGRTLTLQGVGLYLARWGFTPQKPLKRAYEQKPQAVQTWLNETYPEIARRAQTEGAEIQWGDETGLRSDDVRGRSYAPIGKTPERRVMSKREGLSIMSTVTNRGQVRWKVFEGAMNADILIDFLKRLIKDMRSKKVFLILDNLKVHHAKLVKAWLAEHADKIEVFYLPSYSPELNPDEMLNADLKASITRQAPARTKGHLKKAAMQLDSRSNLSDQ
ncbi:IS630 family transposase (plasmid) [Burkholderia sp. MS455]|uniref:IS630 family transposase n=1 Tax=Burkholderia sp. MS455 TaxID=2811788 RepID=UPI00195C17B5|nr:IS630 family transposase [Burkholderia sp. MS455]QRR11826.1 IS630 family transposase [Burkholderia sp. MS455]